MLTFHRASHEEVPLIRTLACEAFPATYGELLSPGQLAYMMDWMYSPESLRRQLDEGQVFYIARFGEEPCGYLSVERQEPTLFHLQKLYLLPRFQGRGLGAALFGHAVEHIRTLCADPCVMELNVNRNNPAVHFYKRLGMRIVREGDFPIGGGYFMNDYIMALTIG